MPGSQVPFQNLVRHMAELLNQRSATLWLGEDVSSISLPTGVRLLRKIARVTLHALQPITQSLPSSDAMVQKLESLGAELALSVADRSIGRVLPVALEDPFDGVRARLPEWQSLLQTSLRGMPGYVHRAIATLAEAGYVARIVTNNQDELMEAAALRIGYKLPVVNAIEGDPIPEGVFKSYLFKLHGTSSRPDGWPMDLHRLHLACDSSAMASLRTVLESWPLIVLGYRGPDPFDLWPLLTRTRLAGLVWADESRKTIEVQKFSPRAGPQILEGDFASRLLRVHGGWRVQSRLPMLLEAVCEALDVTVFGPAPDEEETALRDLDDLFFSTRDDQPLSPALQQLAQRLRTHWVGAFALITWLDLWSEEALDQVFRNRVALEQTLPDNKSRAWFRVLLAQTGRPQVEEAFIRHFSGDDAPPSEPATVTRLGRALAALDLKGFLPSERPAHEEELEVERDELGFALTRSGSYLPPPSQVTAEIPSVTHTERWHRLKAAGAVSRQQWSVAIQELLRALAQGGESGSPLMKLRARLAMALSLHHLIRKEDPAPLVGVLSALKRKEPNVTAQVITSANAVSIAAGLALRLYDQVLQGYAIHLPTLQPRLKPVVEQFIELAFLVSELEPVPYFFDRDPERGRSYSYLPDVESLLAATIAFGPQ